MLTVLGTGLLLRIRVGKSPSHPQPSWWRKGLWLLKKAFPSEG
jgi:hypothetical protein